MKDHIQQFSLLITLVITLAMTFACASQALAEVYKTVDKDGNVIYTDQPPDPQSKPMDLPGLSVIAPQLPANPTPAAGWVLLLTSSFSVLVAVRPAPAKPTRLQRGVKSQRSSVSTVTA